MAGVGEAIAAWSAFEVAYAVFAATAVAMSVGAAIQAASASTETSDSAETKDGQQANTCSNTIPLPLVYGRTRVGINRVYVGVSGTNAKYLHIIGNICEGEITGFVQINSVDQLFLGDNLYTEYGSLVYYELFLGSPTQTVCATLQAAIPEWDDPKKNTAYLYIRLEYDEDYFSGVPDITVVIDGLKIYNPATTTTGYSNNPALIARDFMIRSSKRGGMNIAAARIDDDLVIDAATYCTAKGWTCDICLASDETAIDMFQHILATFRGVLIYSGSKFQLKYADLNYESSVMAITEDDIVESGKSTLKIEQPSIFDTPNAICCKYINANKYYTEDDYILSDSDAITADGSYRESSAEIYGMTSQANVMMMTNYLLEKARLNKTASITMGSRGMALEPHDIVTITHTRPGWDTKMFRVASVNLAYEGNVALNLVEEYDAFYDDTYEISDFIYHDTTLPNPSDPVPSVINVTHSEELYYYRNRSFTRWMIYFDPPATSTYPWWDYANIYLKVGDAEKLTLDVAPATTWAVGDTITGAASGSTCLITSKISDLIYTIKNRSAAFTLGEVLSNGTYTADQGAANPIVAEDWKFQTKSTGDYQLDPVEEGTTYYCKIQSVSIFGSKQSFDDAYEVSKTILGNDGTPSDMTAITALAHGDTLTIFGNELSDPDIAGYELRLGLAWGGGIYMAFNETPNFRLVGVRPGTHTFWCKAKTNAGIYSANAVSATVIVYYPSGYVDIATWAWDFDAIGTFDNTEHETYDGSDALKCSHWYKDSADLLTNGDFPDDITSWLAFGTESSVYDTATLKVVAGEAYAGRYQNIVTTENTNYILQFIYKNTAGDLAAYKIYDQTNGADIVALTDLADSEAWSDEQTIYFTAPAGCISVGIYLLGKANTDIVWFDTVSAYKEDVESTLTGTWLSPEYDLGSEIPCRIWGDFISAYVSTGGTWGALFPGTSTWADRIITGLTRWRDLLAPDSSGMIQATLYWGSVTEELTESADYLEILAPEITARYVQVKITITDPDTLSNMHLKTLNMTAAYW